MSNTAVKENKGRSKSLPKLKTILANPLKTQCPTLSADEMEKLADMLRSDLKESGQEARAFLSTRNLRLGLESCLRAINNCRSAFILLSLRIKPCHLVGLIARNSEIRDKTVPVYAQPDLESFTEKLFGVKALAMVLPRDMSMLSANLQQWIDLHKKLKPLKRVMIKKPCCTSKKTVSRKDIKIEKEVDIKKTSENMLVIDKTKSLDAEQEYAWSNDFISLSNTSENIKLDELNLGEDKEHLRSALIRMAKNIKTEVFIQSSPQVNSDKMDIDDKPDDHAEDDDISESNDFLDIYKPLTVHKIRPNPSKKQKKKRKNKNSK